MGTVEKIQFKFGRFFLGRRKKKVRRNRKAYSIEKASSIGIIYDATNRAESDTVKKFVQYLKEERKQVLSLGYINSNNTSEMVSAHLNYIYFDKNDLSKMMIPHNNDVEKFIQTPFNILIDLTLKKCFPIEYITAMSLAQFKVGAKGAHEEEHFDLILDIETNKTLHFLITQVKHYLGMIKT